MTTIIYNHFGTPIQVVGVYVRPTETFGNLKSVFHHLSQKLSFAYPTIIMGDFNMDSTSTTSSYKSFDNFMQHEFGFSQLISEFTTNERTTIDLIFVNFTCRSHNTGVLEYYYSYHKPIWISIDAFDA